MQGFLFLASADVLRPRATALGVGMMTRSLRSHQSSRATISMWSLRFVADSRRGWTKVDGPIRSLPITVGGWSPSTHCLHTRQGPDTSTASANRRLAHGDPRGDLIDQSGTELVSGVALP